MGIAVGKKLDNQGVVLDDYIKNGIVLSKETEKILQKMKKKMDKPKSFTGRQFKDRKWLISDVGISRIPNDDEIQKGIIIKPYKAMWDTGSTYVSLSEKVVKELQLREIDKVVGQTASGSMPLSVHEIYVYLPGKILICDVLAVSGLCHDKVDVAIGMNIIMMGDFAISKKGNEVIFSFRFPSIETIDFTMK